MYMYVYTTHFNHSSYLQTRASKLFQIMNTLTYLPYILNLYVEFVSIKCIYSCSEETYVIYLAAEQNWLQAMANISLKVLHGTCIFD